MTENSHAPESEESPREIESDRKSTRSQTALLALIPLVALASLIWLFVAKGDVATAPIREDVENLPKPESISFERITFKPSQIVAFVRNTGPEPFTVAGVHVNDMATEAYVSPSNTIPRLSSATVTIPHDWVEGDPYEIRLVSSTGLFHNAMVDVASLTPILSSQSVGVFALLGLFVGVIPVYLGLMWFPVIRRLKERAMTFFLAFTVGLLVFLGVDALEEALEVRERIGEPLQPTMLILIGSVATFLVISWVSNALQKAGASRGEGYFNLSLAYMVAFAVGVHNLGEGLAIGAAYAIGEVTLGGLLVIGFMIHNTTEGIAIVSPIARTGTSLKHLLLMGLLGGAPTILGAWIGGFAYGPTWSLLFLSVGSGAVFQVVYVIGKQMVANSRGSQFSGSAAAGLVAGLVIMYFTGLLVS